MEGFRRALQLFVAHAETETVRYSFGQKGPAGFGLI